MAMVNKLGQYNKVGQYDKVGCYRDWAAQCCCLKLTRVFCCAKPCFVRTARVEFALCLHLCPRAREKSLGPKHAMSGRAQNVLASPRDRSSQKGCSSSSFKTGDMSKYGSARETFTWIRHHQDSPPCRGYKTSSFTRRSCIQSMSLARDMNSLPALTQLDWTLSCGHSVVSLRRSSEDRPREMLPEIY